MPKAVFYARVSKKDKYGLNGSIHAQFDLMENFWKSISGTQEDVLFLADNGYSGRDSMRPAFRRLLGKVALGEVDVLVIKDFSRLSRDYILFGFLCREIFVRYNVRFLSVVEGYDSLNRGVTSFGMDIRSVFNEFYCHDVSRKVKMTFDAKRQSGDYSCRKPPFGYKWNDDKTSWDIVEEEAEIVRNVFEMYAEGMTLKVIGMEVERQYVKYNGTGGYKRKSNWEPAAVWQILHNPAYLGYQVWHKYEVSPYLYGEVQAVPHSEWELRNGTHKPIIKSKEWEDFILSDKTVSGGMFSSKGKRHMFHGLTKCGDCGRALSCGRHDKNVLCCNHCSGHEEKRIETGKLFEACLSEFYLILRKNRTKSSGSLTVNRKYKNVKEMFLHHFIRRIEVYSNGKVNIYWAFKKSDIN